MSIRTRWAIVLVPALLLYFFPVPSLNPGQRHLLAIFVGTIISLVAQPVVMGVSVLLAMTILVLTGTLPGTKVLSGFSNATVWLIFTAFLFARAITATGFGLRVAYLFVRRFGHSALTLGYSVAASDLALAPFIPSDTARGGGVIYPIARSLAQVFESDPGPTAGRIGAFLMLVGFHATYTTSAMFLTGMAANPLIAEMARKIAHVDLTWGQWAVAAAVPGLLSLTVIPYLIYRLHPPTIRDTQAAQRHALQELHRMGPLSGREWRLLAILLGVMAGWVTSPWHGLHNAFVALAGVSAILLSRVLTWDDLLHETKAWDALIWFAGLLMMADALLGFGRYQNSFQRRLLAYDRLALAAGGRGSRLHIFICSLRIRQHDRARYRTLSRISRGRPGGRRSAALDGPASSLFLKPRCRHDSLRHRLRPSLFRRGLRIANHVVAPGIPDIASQSNHLAGRRLAVVEGIGDVVTSVTEPRP